MPVSNVVIVPTDPRLVPTGSSAQPPDVAAPLADLRARVVTALDTLPDTGTALLLVPGPESVVHDATVASLPGHDRIDVRVAVRIDRGLLTAVSARGQAPRVRSDRLESAAAVVALLLAEHRPALALAPVAVPVGASAFGLHGITLGLEAAVKARTGAGVDGNVAVVASGDLAAAHSAAGVRGRLDGAAAWDAEVVAAVGACDADRLGALGPAEASRFQAPGWAPLVAAVHLAVAADRRFQQVDYAAPDGVGQLTAS